MKKKSCLLWGYFYVQKKRIKEEEKIRITRAYGKGMLSLNAAEQLGVHHSVVDDWVCQYESEGIEAFLTCGGNRRYEPAIKEAAVKDYLSSRVRKMTKVIAACVEICNIYVVFAKWGQML